MCGGKVPVEFERLPQGFDRPIILARKVEHITYIRVDSGRNGIKLSGAFDLRNGLLVLPHEVEIEGVPQVCCGKVGVQLDGALVFAFGSRPLPSIPFAKGQRVVRVSQALIQLQRLARRNFGFGRKLSWVEHATGCKIAVGGRQFGIGERVSRINGYCLIVILYGFLRVFRPSHATIKEALEHQFISLWVHRLAPGELLLLTGTQVQAQLLGDLSGNLRLHCQ